jgi:hypothetical protein
VGVDSNKKWLVHEMGFCILIHGKTPFLRLFDMAQCQMEEGSLPFLLTF